MKVRYYDFLSPGASVPLEKIETLIVNYLSVLKSPNPKGKSNRLIRQNAIIAEGDLNMSSRFYLFKLIRSWPG